MRSLSRSPISDRNRKTCKMGKKVKGIAYICDGLAACSDKVGCYRLARPGISYCSHTTDRRHAKYGAVNDPEKYPDRFVKIDYPEADEEIKYWEGEIDIPNIYYKEEK